MENCSSENFWREYFQKIFIVEISGGNIFRIFSRKKLQSKLLWESYFGKREKKVVLRRALSFSDLF